MIAYVHADSGIVGQNGAGKTTLMSRPVGWARIAGNSWTLFANVVLKHS